MGKTNTRMQHAQNNISSIFFFLAILTLSYKLVRLKLVDKLKITMMKDKAHRDPLSHSARRQEACAQVKGCQCLIGFSVAEDLHAICHMTYDI